MVSNASDQKISRLKNEISMLLISITLEASDPSLRLNAYVKNYMVKFMGKRLENASCVTKEGHSIYTSRTREQRS